MVMVLLRVAEGEEQPTSWWIAREQSPWLAPLLGFGVREEEGFDVDGFASGKEMGFLLLFSFFFKDILKEKLILIIESFNFVLII